MAQTVSNRPASAGPTAARTGANRARPTIGYLVQDLGDPAVARRVRMLKAGGADVVLVGFRRGVEAIAEVEGAPAFDLGRTRDLKLLSRVGSVAGAALTVGRWVPRLQGSDRLIARNLEMLLLARLAQRRLRPSPPLAYEVLDIHQLMLGEGRASRVLRALERRLASRIDLLMVSSPAFVDAYFAQRWPMPPPVKILENKVLDLPTDRWRRAAPRSPGPPWRIGWFGMLRCQRSLDILCDLARRRKGEVEVIIRGRPTLGLFRDFHAQVGGAPHVSYLGAYAPADLPAHYAETHFAWSMDFYEAGQNSAWLLPNRLYEGQFMGVVPIAQRDVETGRWLSAHRAGALFDRPEDELAPWFEALTPAAYGELAEATRRLPDAVLASGVEDCADLVATLDPASCLEGRRT